jgi:hypothetical protein
MIIQILGVALISLLTITPTIQQNNIEQLKVPNIEITTSTFNTSDPNRIFVANQFSYYDSTSNLFLPYNGNLLKTNFSQYIYSGSDITYNTTTNYGRSTHITDTDFYITKTADRSINGNFLQALIQDYYTKTKGSITSTSFSFSASDTGLSTNTSFYTYQVNGSGGSINGRFYYVSNSDVNPHNHTKNSNITIPTNANINELFNQLNINNIWAYSDNRFNQKILYYFLDSNMPSTVGSHTRTIHGRDNYGFIRSFGSITINMIAPDTTPPVINSITGNPTDWTNQNVTLTINATDNVALGDLNTPPYSFDNGATFQFSNQKIFTTNEIVNIRVRDLAGNFTNQQVIINRIDKQSPAVTLPQGWVSSYPVNTITAQQLLATYNISDNQSGVNTSLTTISNFNSTVIGSYNPIISVTDNAGNTFNYTSPTVNITEPADSTGPVITGPISLTYQLGTITFNSIIEQYIIEDVSGIEPNTTSIRNTSNQVITNFNLTIGTYLLRIYARDTLGNETNYPITLIVQDTVAPVITGNTVQQLVVNRTQQDLINRFSISDDSDITVEIIGNINYGFPGSYFVTLRATDSVGNVTNLSITVNITLPDTTGPLISGAFGISVEVGLFNDNQQFINQYFTITDPSGIKSTVLTGTLDFNVVGSYNVVLVATDNEDNVSNRQLTIKVYDPINLADYNPLTDLFSGIFGGLLSMIFTIGTINLLGFRLLDAMALIILGSVIWLVYKAIKGGS